MLYHTADRSNPAARTFSDDEDGDNSPNTATSYFTTPAAAQHSPLFLSSPHSLDAHHSPDLPTPAQHSPLFLSSPHSLDAHRSPDLSTPAPRHAATARVIKEYHPLLDGKSPDFSET